MDLTQRISLRIGESMFGGVAVLGLAGCTSSVAQEEVADAVRGSDDPVVDLQDVMIDPMNPELLLPDGLHPDLEVQRTIAAALVEQLVEGQGQ